jgi:hypothetical protein
MGAYKRYAKKGYANAKKFVKKRYAPKGKVNIVKIARDVQKIQRSLNVEHKHIDYAFGTSNGLKYFPTQDNPVIIPLPTPIRGTSYNQRVGNQIRVVHMTSKLQFEFKNTSDLISSVTCRAQILFAKNSDDVPDITQLYELDPNGNYTPLSMANTQEWNKFKWIKALSMTCKNTDRTNRYNYSSDLADTRTQGGATAYSVTDPASVPLNAVKKYMKKATKCSTRISFKNNTDVVEQYKPYLLIRSDVLENTNPLLNDYDPVSVSGTIRMTYVDN